MLAPPKNKGQEGGVEKRDVRISSDNWYKVLPVLEDNEKFVVGRPTLVAFLLFW